MLVVLLVVEVAPIVCEARHAAKAGVEVKLETGAGLNGLGLYFYFFIYRVPDVCLVTPGRAPHVGVAAPGDVPIAVRRASRVHAALSARARAAGVTPVRTRPAIVIYPPPLGDLGIFKDFIIYETPEKAVNFVTILKLSQQRSFIKETCVENGSFSFSFLCI